MHKNQFMLGLQASARTPQGELTTLPQIPIVVWCGQGLLPRCPLPKTLLPLPKNPSPALGNADLELRCAGLACPSPCHHLSL